MPTISSIPAYAPSRKSECDARQSAGLRMRFAEEVHRSRSLQLVLTIAIPILVATYLTLGIIRIVSMVSGVEQNPVTIPSSTARADQR